MAETASTYRMRKLSENCVLTVTVIETPEWKVRRWLGMAFIWVAVQAWGCRVEFQDGKECPKAK